MTPTAGIYVHMPFCPYICPYCDFAKEPWRASREQRYLAALSRELDRAPAVHAATVFLGGGTPNLTGPETLSALILRVREQFQLACGAEITVECNPDPQHCAGLEHYVAAGVTRISIGAQSFVLEELKQLGRRHSPEDAANLVRAARAAGIETVSVDLIFAAPGQTVDSLEHSLSAVLALEVDHVSCYGLTIEEGTPFADLYARRPSHFASNEHEAELYAYLIRRLEDAGFEQYELSNFARNGKRCRHNENYWANGDYLGFGPGAASYFEGCRRTNTRSLDEYCTALEAGRPAPFDSEMLSGNARAGEAAMLALRRREGIDIASFDRRYNVSLLEQYRSVIDEYADAGLLEVVSGHVRLTERGHPLANEVCAAFIELPEAA